MPVSYTHLMQEWAEAVIILAVVALNAVIGIIQEKKAANALAALKSMSAPTARVLREGEESVVPAILPTSVFMPVPTTMPCALPYMTTDDVYAIFTRSPKGASSGRMLGPSFSDGTLSPCLLYTSRCV